MGLIRRLVALRRDRLVANAVYITLSNASMGALGFLFWVVVTRLFRPDQVGVASTIVSASVLIAYASLLGFNVSFVRFLPTTTRRSEEINTGVILVFLAALLIGGAYLSAIPSFVPQLSFLRSDPLELVAIVVFVAFGAVNVVTDAVFVAFRSAQYNILVDGALQGSIRLFTPFLLIGLGTFGLFTSYGVASVGAVIASLVLMARKFDYQPRLAVSTDFVRDVFRFGASSYLAEMLTMVPILALPVIVIHERGSAAAGYFYLSLQVANLLFSATLAIGQSALAEGANRASTLHQLAARAGRLQGFTVILALILMAAAHTILSVFGRSYASDATLSLVVLLASAPAVSLRNWAVALLRLRHRLRPVLAANFFVAVVPCALSALLIRYGLVWVSVAWMAGNLAGGLVAGAALLPELRGDRAGLPAVVPVVEAPVSLAPVTAASGPAEGGLQGGPSGLGLVGVVQQTEEVLVSGDGGTGVAG